MRVSSITMAITHMDAMVAFYNAVFDAGLAQVGSSPFYRGMIAGMPALFCPNEIAEVEARQNRHQFRYQVDDLDDALRRVEAGGGLIKDAPQIHGNERVVGVVDPDGNTLEFAQSA